MLKANALLLIPLDNQRRDIGVKPPVFFQPPLL